VLEIKRDGEENLGQIVYDFTSTDGVPSAHLSLIEKIKEKLKSVMRTN